MGPLQSTRSGTGGLGLASRDCCPPLGRAIVRAHLAATRHPGLTAPSPAALSPPRGPDVRSAILRPSTDPGGSNPRRTEVLMRLLCVVLAAALVPLPLAFGAEAGREVRVDAAVANVRSAPAPTAQVLFQLRAGDVVRLTS